MVRRPAIANDQSSRCSGLRRASEIVQALYGETGASRPAADARLIGRAQSTTKLQDGVQPGCDAGDRDIGCAVSKDRHHNAPLRWR